MIWWKKLIYPFVWIAVMAIIGILKLFTWLERESKELLSNWQPSRCDGKLRVFRRIGYFLRRWSKRMDRNITTRKWELNNFTKEELIDMYINIYDAQTRAENAIDFLETAKQSLEEEVERLKQRDYQGVLQNICETLKEIRDILKRG